MEFVSFEKVLREVKGIYYVRSRTTTGFNLRVHYGSRHQDYSDDPIASVTGAVVHQMRALFLQFVRFGATPVVGLGSGADVDTVIDMFDMEQFENNVLPVISELDGYQQLVSAYNTHSAAVLEDQEDKPLRKYDLASVLHQIFTKLRLDDEIKFDASESLSGWPANKN